jgi:hypothetical protein
VCCWRCHAGSVRIVVARILGRVTALFLTLAQLLSDRVRHRIGGLADSFA